MRESAYKTLVLAVGIIFCIMLIAGCEEEEKISDTMTDTPDAKRSRLIAVENVQLKKQIEKLTALHASEMKRQKDLNTREKDDLQRRLDNCLREKKGMEEMSKKGVEEYMQNVLGPISEENTKLREEIETLKAQIEKLTKELEELKRPKVVPL
ncbi:MAG: hypothetical protein GWN55_16860 [Phycisphaerae bacterium]|nr:hypothetical protein [Phycisphaerae bacterium]NIS54203.1 hypothetical protein [Phycisphaerae bacterium]NIU11816.1 hypothetical protein [Phycisphaerae bacterium]NIV02961.1 hypothetical protein [Phycisphaerae bacterium]NIV70627.1 hypothetical protein [Phycisphaerae bacterium]